MAEEATRLCLVSTCDILGLNEAKWTANALLEAGIDAGRVKLVLNQTPKRHGFTSRDLEKILGLRVETMMPEARQDFAAAALDGKLLGEGRAFQNSVSEFAARIAGVEQASPEPKARIPFFQGALRSA